MADHEAALAELTSLLAECVEGRGGLALITGGLGSGKTELLRRFADRAAEAGALVLCARGIWSERSLPAGVLDQLVHGAGVSPETTDRLAAFATACAEESSDRSSLRLRHELCSELSRLSHGRPVVISVDDVQFADRQSREFLLRLCRRVSSARLLLVLAEREHSHSLAMRLHAELDPSSVRRVRLGPLSESEVTALLSERLGPTGASRLAPLWCRWSGGNVMLVRAMAADLAAGHEVDERTLGPTGVETVLAALHRWEPSLSAVAKAMAVLADDCSVDLVARLADLTTEVTERLMGALEASGLVMGARFRHAGVRAAVLRGLTADERSALHGRAAEALHRRGDDATTVATHLLALDRVDNWAVDVLRIAAEQALSADEVEDAIRCLELASTAAVGAQRFEIGRMLVRALWRINPAASAAYLEPLRTALWAGRSRGRDVVLVLWHAFWSGDHDTVDCVLAACRENPELLDVRSAAELRIICHVHGLGPESGDAPEGGPPSSDPWAEAGRVLGRFWTTEFDRRDLSAAEHVLKSSHPGETAPEVVVTALLALVFAGEPDSAARWCERMIARAVDGGANTWRALCEVVRAHLTLRRGDSATAFRLAASAMRLLPTQGWGVLIGYPVAVQLLALTETGEPDVLEELLRLPVPEAMFDGVIGLFYLHARGHAHLAQGRALAAISDFQTCAARMRQRGSDLPLVAPWRLDLAEANLALGRPDAARDLVTEQLGNADRRTRGIALRLLAELNGPRQRAELLRKSVELLKACGDGRELARTRRRFERLFDGRTAHVDRLAAHGVPALSDSERRVAELAALGHTNREISALLYITVSTVEQHLTRVYRKLGVKGRAELPRELGIHADACGTGA